MKEESIDVIEISKLKIGCTYMCNVWDFSSACVDMLMNMHSNFDGTSTCITADGRVFIYTTKLSKVERIK